MLTKDQFIEFLTENEMKLIYDCLEGGVADYDDLQMYPPRARRDHTKSVRSHIRNAHINARAQRAIVGSDRIRYTPARGRPLFTFGDRIVLSFKKLDKNHRPRNGRTRQSQLFMTQQQLPLNLHLPETTNLVAGYTIDQFETKTEFFVTCPGPKSNHWEVSLERPDPGNIRDIDLQASPTPVPRRRVTPRVAGSRGESNEKNSDAATG